MSQENDNKAKVWSTVIDLSKWFIGTVVIGLAGVFINNEIQQTELAIKRVEADTKLLQTITNNTDNNRTDSLELRYLSFVKTFITTDKIKGEVSNRIEDLKYNLTLANKQKAEEKNKSKTEQAKSIINDIDRNKIIQVEKDLINNSDGARSIEDLKLKENDAASNLITTDSLTIATLNSNQKMIAKVQIKKDKYTYKLIGEPITKWCKKGFYVEFNNSLRIGIDKLTRQSITFNLKDIEESNNPSSSFKKGISLAEGEVYKIDRNQKQYHISLNYIGSAGRNPFSKAAYLTVSTYVKQLTNKE